MYVFISQLCYTCTFNAKKSSIGHRRSGEQPRPIKALLSRLNTLRELIKRILTKCCCAIGKCCNSVVHCLFCVIC